MPKKGDFVRIHKVILTSDERAPQVPEDTKKVPMELWTKGFLQDDANLGDEVKIITLANREETGTLIEVNQAHDVNYGDFVPEIVQIGVKVKKELFGE
jgi:hypothetical protein